MIDRRVRKHLKGFDSPAEGSDAEIKASTGKPALGLAWQGYCRPALLKGGQGSSGKHIVGFFSAAGTHPVAY